MAISKAELEDTFRRQVVEAKLRATADSYSIDQDLAVELSKWGDLSITRKKCFTLRIGQKDRVNDYKTGDKVTTFVYDGQHNVAGMTIRSLKNDGLWEHVVEIPTIPTSDVKIGMGSGKEFLYAVWDLGAEGKMRFGISRDGSFECKWH